MLAVGWGDVCQRRLSLTLAPKLQRLWRMYQRSDEAWAPRVRADLASKLTMSWRENDELARYCGEIGAKLS